MISRRMNFDRGDATGNWIEGVSKGCVKKEYLTFRIRSVWLKYLIRCLVNCT